MSQPIYIVQTRQPGETFKTVTMGKGRFSHYFGKYMECLRAGLHTRFVTVSTVDNRMTKRECGETEWNNHTHTK